MSLVAVCWARATVSSWFRASSSLNSRTFSIAMTAWSANVWSSKICASVNGRTSCRATAIAPITRPSSNIGTARVLRLWMVCAIDCAYSASDCASSMWTTAPSRTARPCMIARVGRVGNIRWTNSIPSGLTWLWAARCRSSPSYRETMLVVPSHNRIALLAIASNTGWVSVGDWLMTRRISLVAVCWSSAVVKSRLLAWSSVNSRTFSMAMTAWSAKVWSSSISASGTRLARSASGPSRRSLRLLEHRHRYHASVSHVPGRAGPVADHELQRCQEPWGRRSQERG